MHLKHFFLSPNTGRDLNLTKNVLRLETEGAINVQIKASEEDTILWFFAIYLHICNIAFIIIYFNIVSLLPKSRC